MCQAMLINMNTKEKEGAAIIFENKGKTLLNI